MFQWLPFLTQAGGSVDKLDQPEAATALQFWADMVKNGIASKDVINQRQYEVANTFMAGNTAMALGGPWELPRMQTEAKFDWRSTLLPVKDDKNISASALGGYNFVIAEGRQAGRRRLHASSSSCPTRRFLNEGWKTGRLAPRTDVTVQNPQWPQAYAIYREQMQYRAPARSSSAMARNLARHSDGDAGSADRREARRRRTQGGGKEDPANSCEDAALIRDGIAARPLPDKPE